LIRYSLALTLLLSALCGVLALAQQPEKDIDEDRDEQRVVRRAIHENCLICHSEEMIVSQRLTAKQWKAEVEKMVGWGSPLPIELRQPVIDRLSADYPDNAPGKTLARRTARELLGALEPEAAGAVAKGDSTRGAEHYARHCANCHGGDGQGDDLGSNLVEKPVLLRPTAFSAVTRQGRGRMPGFGPLLDAQGETDILAWLRSRRFVPRSPRSP
jgi:ubiquinol-cytochrome c reductase cytochrome c subunit